MLKWRPNNVNFSKILNEIKTLHQTIVQFCTISYFLLESVYANTSYLEIKHFREIFTLWNFSCFMCLESRIYNVIYNKSDLILYSNKSKYNSTKPSKVYICRVSITDIFAEVNIYISRRWRLYSMFSDITFSNNL